MGRWSRTVVVRRTALVLLLGTGVLSLSCAAGRAVEPPPAPLPAPTEPETASPPPPPPETAPSPKPPREPRERPESSPGGLTPLPGSVLPRERIVAFYGNPRSDRMGILGELPPEQMLAQLDREVLAWQQADPETPVRPALHMIAVMATADPGPDGRYRLRMPRQAIEDVLSWAARRRALVFLDIQPGHSSVEAELEALLPWLRRPDVHLALDPEWRMAAGGIPGKRIGSMSAREINHAIGRLAALVEEEGLPPKVLVVHRFTAHMIPDVQRIEEDPRVQVVLNMDGWGPPGSKVNTYQAHVAPAPVPYKGFKLFYRNDRWNGSTLMSPEEVLALSPEPIYIQYQ